MNFLKSLFLSGATGGILTYIKVGLISIVLFTIAGLSGYCKYLDNQNKKLESELIKLTNDKEISKNSNNRNIEKTIQKISKNDLIYLKNKEKIKEEILDKEKKIKEITSNIQELEKQNQELLNSNQSCDLKLKSFLNEKKEFTKAYNEVEKIIYEKN